MKIKTWTSGTGKINQLIIELSSKGCAINLIWFWRRIEKAQYSNSMLIVTFKNQPHQNYPNRIFLKVELNRNKIVLLAIRFNKSLFSLSRRDNSTRIHSRDSSQSSKSGLIAAENIFEQMSVSDHRSLLGLKMSMNKQTVSEWQKNPLVKQCRIAYLSRNRAP